MFSRGNIDRQRGVVLPTVLWIVTMSLIVAANYTSLNRQGIRTVDNNKTAFLLKQAARSGMYLSLERVLDIKMHELSGYDEVTYRTKINGADVETKVIFNNVLIPINETNEEQIEKILLRNGIENTQATVVSSSLLDWVDKDHNARAYGMEDNGYFESGSRFGAKDQAIRDFEELRMVNGVDEQVLAILKTHFTLYPGTVRNVVSISSDATIKGTMKKYRVEAQVQMNVAANKPYRILKISKGTQIL